MLRSFRKVFQVELLERREQPNDMFSLGGSLFLGLDSGFLRDSSETRSQGSADLPALVSELAPASVGEGTVFASPTDFSGSSFQQAPAPVTTSSQLQEAVEAVTTIAALSGTGQMSLLEMSGNEAPGTDGTRSGSWATNAPIPVVDGLSQTTAVSDLSGRVYSIGGGTGAGPTTRINDLRRYDPSTGTWSTLAPIPHAAGGAFYDSAAFSATQGAEGSIWVFGGILGAGGGAAPTNLVYRYDIAANTWSAAAPLPLGPRFGSCVSEIFGYIWVSGGASTVIHNDFMLFDTYNNTWITGLPPMPAGNTFRMHGAFATWENGATLELQHHCFAGGFDGRLHHVFNLNTGVWTARPLIPTGVTDPGVDAAYNLTDGYNQSIFVSGGIGANAGLVQRYNVRTQTWGPNPPLMPSATNNTSSALSNFYELYVLGGFNGTTSTPVNYSFPSAYDV